MEDIERNLKHTARRDGPSPAMLAKSGTEHAIQTAFFAWAAIAAQEQPLYSLLYAIPNGGQRSKSQAATLKAEGVKSGVPDVHFPVARGGYFGLYIEFKKPAYSTRKVGGMSDAQVAFARKLTAQGFLVIVCYGWQDAASRITSYINLTESYQPIKRFEKPLLFADCMPYC